MTTIHPSPPTAAGSGTPYPVCLLEEIPSGQARAFAVGAEQVAVFHLRSGVLRAVSARCPHKGGPIADGQSDDRVVMCPLHANVFDLATGECTTGAAPLRTYPVTVDGTGPQASVVVTLP